MSRAEEVMLRFDGSREAGNAVCAAKRFEFVISAGQEFMSIALMPDIKNYSVFR
ncbi:unknown [Ruminococcus sp. CAG:382]|nr:unknown [Ruminococcus sp. CAG:382]